jgi:hypothetical protein
MNFTLFEILLNKHMDSYTIEELILYFRRNRWFFHFKIAAQNIRASETEISFYWEIKNTKNFSKLQASVAVVNRYIRFRRKYPFIK